jgi:hypothetical protein
MKHQSKRPGDQQVILRHRKNKWKEDFVKRMNKWLEYGMCFTVSMAMSQSCFGEKENVEGQEICYIT